MLEHADLAGELEAGVYALVEHYNHLPAHESLGNLTLADIYLGRGEDILREWHKSNARPSPIAAYAITCRLPNFSTEMNQSHPS